MLTANLAITVWMLLGQGQVTVAASDDLASARALYANGDYEEALTRLSAAKTERTADEVDQYRALCLLALGRNAETEKSLAELVSRSPLYRMTDADVSPRLVSLFHTVRRRLLPSAVRDLYTRARGNFEQKQFPLAALQLRDLMDLLQDEDLEGEARALGDLKLIAEGFLKLALTEIEEAAKAAAAAAAARPAPPAPSPTAAAAPEPPATPRVYSDADEGITAPVAVSRAVPAYRRPANVTPAAAGRSYQGHLRVVIDEAGRVESAGLIRPFLEGFDAILLEAVRQWQFRPATRDGQPVKYLKLFTIDVSPR
jgi:TonB family protein